MFRVMVGIVLLVVSVSISFAAKEKDADKSAKPKIAVLDVQSSSFDSGKTKLLTDYFSSELFKSGMFTIVERGQIQKIIQEHSLQLNGMTADSDMLKAGKLLSVEKLFVCTIEKFSDSIAINARVIDVNTAMVDYNENLIVQNEKILFDAMKDLVAKMQVYYRSLAFKQDKGGADSIAYLKTQWSTLGAKSDELLYLMNNKVDPDIFMQLRQYDVSITVSDYIELLKNNWDIQVVRNFMQAGISYMETKKAIGMGILRLDSFINDFKPEGYTFKDYINAYANRITSVDEYRLFKEAYRQDRFVLGAGGIADSFPVGQATFKFFIIKLGWEHFWTEFQRDPFKWSTEFGLYGMNVVVPVPYGYLNAYFGAHPFYFKVGVGGVAELILGGHFGMMCNIGIEILEQYEITVMVSPIGSQPTISYTDLQTRYGATNYIPITFPYYGITFNYKF